MGPDDRRRISLSRSEYRRIIEREVSLLRHDGLRQRALANLARPGQEDYRRLVQRLPEQAFHPSPYHGDTIPIRWRYYPCTADGEISPGMMRARATLERTVLRQLSFAAYDARRSRQDPGHPRSDGRRGGEARR
jgi:hypothetical protein